MKHISRSTTNPTLRKLYRATKTIAKNADIGEKVMCPCGCLQEFHKKTDNHTYATTQDNACKDRYYSRTRSKSNYAFTQGMLKIRDVMSKYVAKNKIEKPKPTKSTPEKADLSNNIENEATSENYVKLLKQAKTLSKSAKCGDAVMCPCGCNDIFVKNTAHQAFSRKNGTDCKDEFYTLTRQEEPVEMDLNKILSFKKLYDYVSIEVEKRKVLENKPTTKRRNRP